MRSNGRHYNTQLYDENDSLFLFAYRDTWYVD